MQSKIKVVIVFIAVFAWIFFFYTPLSNIIKQKIREDSICKKPIKYSISNFDSRFGISRDEYKDNLFKAEKIWEDETGLNLFEYVDRDGVLSINLVYDIRQKTTNNLQYLEESILNNKSNIDLNSLELNTQKNIYSEKKNQYSVLVDSYRIKEARYLKSVTNFNKSNNNSDSLRNSLIEEKKTLDNMLLDIKSKENELNNINETLAVNVDKLNLEVDTVNQEVAKYNDKTDDFSEEFNEGEYVVKNNAQYITVYQFDSKERLIRLLAHEFGHSLGVSHVEDQDSIMYRLNSGQNLKLSESDLLEIKNICSKNSSLYSKVFHSNI